MVSLVAMAVHVVCQDESGRLVLLSDHATFKAKGHFETSCRDRRRVGGSGVQEVVGGLFQYAVGQGFRKKRMFISSSFLLLAVTKAL